MATDRGGGAPIGPLKAVLFVPLDRELLEEIRKFESSWLSTFQDGLDDRRGKEREAQDTTEVGFIDRFCFGEIADGSVASGLQQVAPAEGADDGLDDGVIHAGRGWNPWR